MITEETLCLCLESWQEKILRDEDLCEIFYKMAEEVGKTIKLDGAEEYYREAARFALAKAPKYKGGKKAKAINFFVTIISCYLRQIKNIQKRLKNANS